MPPRTKAATGPTPVEDLRGGRLVTLDRALTALHPDVAVSLTG